MSDQSQLDVERQTKREGPRLLVMDATDVPWTEPIASTSRVSRCFLLTCRQSTDISSLAPTQAVFTLPYKRGDHEGLEELGCASDQPDR